METIKLRIPEHFKSHPEAIMSNFDHEIDDSAAEFIKDKQLYAQYAGWNFSGRVYWIDERWYCDVWVYGSYRKTFVSDTLQGIMSDVCSQYGND